MSDHRIGLTDELRAILDRKLQRAQAAQQRADKLAQDFNEEVRLLAGGDDAIYQAEEGVVVVVVPEEEGGD